MSIFKSSIFEHANRNTQKMQEMFTCVDGAEIHLFKITIGRIIQQASNTCWVSLLAMKEFDIMLFFRLNLIELLIITRQFYAVNPGSENRSYPGEAA